MFRPHLDPVSIADVVDDVLDRMKPIGAGRAIRRDIPNDSPLTPLDFVQISQAITNLLDNALRYSPASSGIAISAEVLHEQLRVTVLNEGHIPLGELDYIFDRFYRSSTSSGGIGLGLSIVRGIVEAHGGRVWAENVDGRRVAVSFTSTIAVRFEISRKVQLKWRRRTAITRPRKVARARASRTIACRRSSVTASGRPIEVRDVHFYRTRKRISRIAWR